MASHSQDRNGSLYCFITSVPASVKFSSRPASIAVQRHPRLAPLRRQRRCTVPRRYPASCADAAEFAPLPSTPEPCASATPEPCASTPSYEPRSASVSLSRIGAGMWQFTRPHTIYGTLISVTSVSILALQASSKIAIVPFLSAFATALIPALLLNIYIVGLNQFYDVEIDRINKPYLPIPAGVMTMRDAAAVVTASLVSGLSFCLSPLSTVALRTVLVGSTVLGTLYSIPPFRLKRFALLASIAILSVRGVLVNIGFFLHAAHAVGVQGLTPLVAFATVFFMIFGIVIALLKDVPDVHGDRIFGIRTFSVRLGARAVFNACAVTLVAMFSVAAMYCFRISKSSLGGIAVATAHFLVAAVLGRQALAVDTESPKEIYKFYMSSWKAFYLEYLLLPIAGL